MAGMRSIAGDNAAQNKLVDQAKKALAILKKHDRASFDRISAQYKDTKNMKWSKADCILTDIQHATYGTLLARYIQIKTGLVPLPVIKPEPKRVKAEFVYTPHRDDYSTPDNADVVEQLRRIGIHARPHYGYLYFNIPRRDIPDTDWTAAPYIVARATEPAPEKSEGKERRAETRERKPGKAVRLHLEQLKPGDGFMYRTGGGETVRCVVSRIEFDHLFADVPGGEFNSLQLFIPSWTYQKKTVELA